MKEREQKIMNSSFLDENLHITKDKCAVSYVKKAYDSSSDDAHRAGNEHAFIVIQKPGVIYRADVKQRDNGTDFIIRTGQKEFVTFAGFKKAKHDIIWGSNDKTNHPKEHLYQWTWLVSRAKAEELEESINLEAGPEEESEKTAILYYEFGEHNILNPGNPTNLLKTIAQIGAALKGWALLAAFGYKAATTSPEVILSSGGSVICHQFLALYAAFITGALGSTVSSMGTKAVTDTLFPTDHLPRYHNCSTWALEKLRNLDIEEINETITPTLFVGMTDKAFHMASLYVGDSEEAKKAFEFYNRVWVRPNLPIIANLEDCAQDIIHSREKAYIRNALINTAAHVGPPIATEVGKAVTGCLSL